MAWNEPPKKDPWNRQKREEEELEESLRRFQERLRLLFGFKKRPPNNTSNRTPGSGFNFNATTIGAMVGFLLLTWILSGIFVVYQMESAVILRFGAYHSTVRPGLHWAPTLIDTVYKFNDQEISNYPYSSDMLTLDENLVSVDVAVQYRIADVKKYRFSVVDPVNALREATASVLRQVIGTSKLNDVLTRGREKIRAEILTELDKLLKKYNTGLMVTDVALQPAHAPEKVKESFDDAIKAQEDEQRYINEAEAQARQIVESAKGRSQRQINEAYASRNQAVLNAKAEIAGFLALIPQYQKAPEVTRTRLYWDTMEMVLTHSNKLVTTDSRSNQMLYLPLDKILEQTRGSSATVPSESNEAEDLQTTATVNTSLAAPAPADPARLVRPSREENRRFPRPRQ